ncbi:MAG: AMP-binding protein [Novosphingobium sp.]|nr:AMP-binding protein [Novosphingobium sp.]
MTLASLAELVRDQRGSGSTEPLLTFVEVLADGTLAAETRSWTDLWSRGQALAGWLRARGMQPGDRFAIMMNNHPEFVDAMVAAAMTGTVWVPVDARTMGDKLQYMLTFTGCVGVVAGDYCTAALADVAGRCPDLRWVLAVGNADDAVSERLPGFATSAALPSSTADQPLDPVAPGDAMFMMFTSGTTGNPKAVVQTHGEWMAYARAGGGVLGLRPGDRLYTGLSLTHINAQGTLRIGLGTNTPVVISRKFTKSRLWDIVRRFDCTVFSLLGGMIPEMFSIPEKPDDADNPVRLITSSGMPAELWDAYRKRFGVEIQEGYGSTEGGGMLINPAGVGPVGSIGKPPPTLEAAVFDENGNRCPPGQPGELRFRPAKGQAKAVAYYRNDDAGHARIRDGWFLTGDIVHQDEDGWFYFRHRAGGGVRRNGDFVNTALVESVISRSGLVADVYVYGVPTARNVAGEKALVAAIVPDAARPFDEAALTAWCRDNLERNDVPEIVQILTAIPKTASEKPVEREAIALLRESGLIDAYETVAASPP